jgi:hypothetical protein
MNQCIDYVHSSSMGISKEKGLWGDTMYYWII